MKTDKELRGKLKESMGEATVIMVAQRVSSIIDADRILVLDKERLSETGRIRSFLRTARSIMKLLRCSSERRR